MWTLVRPLFCRLPLHIMGYPVPQLAGGHFIRHCRRLAIKRDGSVSHLRTQVGSSYGWIPTMALATVSCGIVIWADFLRTESIACQDIFMDNTNEDDLSSTAVTPLEMNELASLTHSSLLRQASGLTVDASLQLLHRALRATLDFSAQYRKQLNHVIDLMEWCTATLRNPEQHDKMCERLVASRSQMESLKQQLKDLNILMNYAYTTLENAAMTAFISKVEFTASAAQQAIDSAKLELENDTKQNMALEAQYIHTHTRYIEVSQKLLKEMEKITEVTDDTIDENPGGND